MTGIWEPHGCSPERYGEITDRFLGILEEQAGLLLGFRDHVRFLPDDGVISDILVPGPLTII
jgi:hypothetical protein